MLIELIARYIEWNCAAKRYRHLSLSVCMLPCNILGYVTLGGSKTRTLSRPCWPFWGPWRPFWICRGCWVAGSEQVTLCLNGNSIIIFFSNHPLTNILQRIFFLRSFLAVEISKVTSRKIIKIWLKVSIFLTGIWKTDGFLQKVIILWGKVHRVNTQLIGTETVIRQNREGDKRQQKVNVILKLD